MRNLDPAKLIANLQRYRREAKANSNFGNIKSIRKGYFKAYSPEVQAKCWEIYNSLCIKHKAKLEAYPWYKRIMVATATRMALDALGITQTSRKGFHRLRIINHTKVMLRVRDKNPNNLSVYKRKVKVPKEPEVGYAP